MNLSPSWVDRLARHGFEAVHWSTIGAATAPDVEILTWANEHAFVLITNDLDFSAILAANSGASPSVVQIRTQDLFSPMSSANRLCCFGARDRGTCSNKLTIRRDEVEARVLKALQDKLLRQDLFEEFTREMNRLRMEHRATLSAAERELE